MNDILNKAVYLEDVPFEDWKNYIGPGYRSVVYTRDANKQGQIIFFGFDPQGNRKTFVCPHQSWIKYKVKYKTEERDVYGDYVATRYFNNAYERKRYVDDANGLGIVEALKPEQEFLHKMFDHCVLESSFNKQPLRIQYIDIETEISDQFEKPVDARNRINMITIYDTQTSKYYTWSLEHADVDFKEEPLNDMPKDMFEFFEFNDNEPKMLEHFLSWIEDNYPDVSVGYNSQAYDWPYIVRRIENVLGKTDAARLSPVGRYRIKEVNHDNERANAQAEIEVDIDGLFIADELILYRDKFHVNHIDGGYGLSNVGEYEGLGKKIAYEGTLKDLYIKDYQKFYEYNVRDVDLLRRIEEKCKLIPLARTVTSNGLTNYGAIYSSISYLIGSVIAFARSEFNRVFTSYLGQKQEAKTYEGAYVFEPIPGLYKGGIATVDFNSLYPSSIQASNLSPETYVGKVVAIRDVVNYEPIDLDDPTVKELYFYPARSRQVKKISKEQLLELCKTKCIFTRNNTLFLKHSVKKGLISEWCRHFYALRKTTKKKMQGLEMDIYNKKVAESDLEATETEIQNLNNLQMSYKLMINSIYGILGTSYSPLYNVDIAQTVTRLGKFCNISASKYIKEWMKKNFGVTDDYVTPVSGDTDSQFVNLQCVTDHFKKEYGLDDVIYNWSDDDKLKLWKFVDGFVETDLNPYIQGLVEKTCFTENSKVLRYSLEYIGDCGIYEKKKHYAVHKIVSEGPELVDKTKYTGIELKKRVVPKQIKPFLAEIYNKTLTGGWNGDDYRKYINELYDKFRNLTIDDVSLWKGYNSEREAVGFLQMELGTTGIAKACNYYNQMLKKLGIGEKYDEIRVGDMVRFTYINPNNIYGINCIAYKDGQWPSEFWMFEVDYDTMFEKVVLASLKGYLNATKFLNADPRNQMVEDIFAM